MADVDELQEFDEVIFVSRWRPITTTILCLFGLGVATYLTIAHYSPDSILTCPLASSVVNCEKVTTSPQSYIFHIPVAVLGLAFFVPMLVLSLPVMWRSSIRLFAIGRTALSVTGVGLVLYLVYAELFEIHTICLWCSSVHILTLALFVIIVTGWNDATAYWVDKV